MNKHNSAARVGLGLLLCLPTLAAGAQGIGGGIAGDDETPNGRSISPPLHWYFPGAQGGGQGGFGGGFGGFEGGGGFGGNGLKSALQRDERWLTLTRTIDVQLDKAPLAQALRALHDASGINISVAKNVADTGKRLSIDARNVPIGTVLEAIAQQMDVMIAPDGAAALLLKPWPSIDINGQKSQYRGQNAPWSDEWETLHPTVNSQARTLNVLGGGGFGGGQASGLSGGLGGKQATPPGNSVTLPRKNNSVPGVFWAPGTGAATTLPGVGWTGAAGTINAAPLSMTVSGDRLVVAEPATGPKGESGYRITVYNLAGGQMKVVGSVFHASARSGRSLPTSPLLNGRTFGGGGFGAGQSNPGFGGGGGFSGGSGNGGGSGGKVKPADKPEDGKTGN